MTHMTATQMSNEATHMSKQDVETVKARTEIKEAIKEHRKTDDKNFRRMITGTAIAMAGLTAVAAANEDPKDNEIIPLGLATTTVMTAGAMALSRHRLEEETKIIGKTKAGTNATVEKNEVGRNIMRFGQMIGGAFLGMGTLVSGPVGTLLALGSVVVAAEAAKRAMANTERKGLEENLGRNMPTQFRMYPQKSR
ncbi:MAG: hypothetical protein IJV75_01945 [Alphaproteobacteria bacterium]|nr:hypothetical protein [Alphaproteobacteria bacterium]